ncbi:MAG: hypothetical protein Q4D19_00600 [Lautropia sp.]|nr:hypothetical protein [Lautropia sp.]
MSDTTLLARPASQTANTRQPVLCFQRTALGQAQLQLPTEVLSPQATRLLMLFEEPQTLQGLREMIDEPWLPEALIDLERRKLVRRASMTLPQRAPADTSATGQAKGVDLSREAARRLARQRAQARILFLQQIGKLSTLMVDRIESCQTEAELQRLSPFFSDLPLPAPSASRNSVSVQ